MPVDPVMYIFLNQGLGMTSGKIGAQAAHAACRAQRMTPADSNLYRLWLKALHEKTVVLLGRDETHMYNIGRYLEDRGFNYCTIYDEGHTEVKPISFTAIGVPLVDKNEPHTAATFSSFELYKDKIGISSEELAKARGEFLKPHQGPTRRWRFWTKP